MPSGKVLAALCSALLVGGTLVSCSESRARPEPAVDAVAAPPPSSATVPPATAPAPTLAALPTPRAETVAVPEPGRVAPAARPEALAARITAAERVVRDSDSSNRSVRAAAFELQQLYRQLAGAPRWERRVLAATPPRLRLAVRANVAARQEFRAMHTTLSDTLPSWRIIDPPRAAQLLSFYRAGEARFGVPWEVLAAVNLVETGMGRIRGTSVAGAQGPMQFMPATWAAFGRGDVNDPRDAVMAAARYLAHNGGGRGQIDNALYRYNNSWRYVRGVKAYAAVMKDDPAAFRGYYHWQIVYASAHGDVWLPTGYVQRESIPVRRYLRANPSHRLTD
ncbi:MAG TPA: transglycosylase SLT domain-containing protein [Nocardioidaceae bacterium]|nr:transglycosylase SLT domain-containing protein [Nocardioidaceae bacterium]